MSKNNPYMLTYIGHLQGRVVSTISKNKKNFITLGQDDLIFMWQSDDMTSKRQIQLSNKQQDKYTCFDYCQASDVFAIGTQSGSVIIVQKNNTSNKYLIYKSDSPISSVKYSPAYNFLVIASNQSRPVLYDNNLKKFFKADVGHLSKTYYSDVVYEQKIMASVGDDGYVNFYLIQTQSINPIQQISKYRICNSQSITQYVNLSERPNKPGHISLAGATTLQQIFIQNIENKQISTFYKIKVQIHQQEQIRKLCWHNQNILVLVLQKRVTLWNYVTKSRFHVLNDHSWLSVISGQVRIFGINQFGTIFKYENPDVIHFQNQQAQKYIQKQAQQQIQKNNVVFNQEQPIEEQVQVEPAKVIRKKPQISKAAKIITKFIQPGLQSFYEQYLQNQFMFYNQHGCIIRRADGEQQLIQLQFHDKFRIRRIKFENRGKYFYYFALTQQCFMYADLSHVYFQMETFNLNKKSDGSTAKNCSVQKWDYKMNRIQGVAIGGGWCAVATKNQIRVFDFVGNQLHCISHNKQYLALAAYEDILAIVYNSTIPFGQSNYFQLKLYAITTNKFKLEKKINMPVKSGKQLKWFGFSHQGCLFNQDTSETIRMYLWAEDTWVDIYEEDSTKFKFYIQHIQNYELYGFRIQLREGQPQAPTVLPRSLPRRILFNFPKCHLKCFTDEQNKRLESIYIRKLTLQHQKFRNSRWFKHRYSRKVDSNFYKYSQSIRSQQELQQAMTQMDINIVQQISKIKTSIQKRLTQQQLQNAKLQILSVCQNLLFYQQSFRKAQRILEINNNHTLFTFLDPIPIANITTTRKYNKVSRLQLMVDKGWIGNQMAVE